MHDDDRITQEICVCTDIEELAQVLEQTRPDESVFRGLASVLAADVLHLAQDPASSLAVAAARVFAGAGCSYELLALAHDCVAKTCTTAPSPSARYARVAARVCSSDSRKGPALVVAVCAVAEAALLASGARKTTQSIRLHQADLARVFLNPNAMVNRAGETR